MTFTTKNQTAIIGAGIAGIATAIRLQVAGHQVTVFETNAHLGGKLAQFEEQGFRFDKGPSLFTLPQLVEELFKLVDKKPEDYFQYRRLDIITKYFYEDGTKITAYANPEKFAQEVHKKTNEPTSVILDFLKKSKRKFDLTADLFLWRSLHQAETWLNAKALRGYLNFNQLDIFRTMNQANEATFQSPHVVQLFNRYATYNGSDPYQTPATLNIIPHLEYNIGAFFPEKGMISIPKSLGKLAKELGVKFILNSKVEKILTKNKTAIGLKINQKDHFFDTIVSNADMVSTYQNLLPDIPAPTSLLKQPKSSSALIFYWGIQKEFPELDVHNIFFSADYRKEFEAIFQQKMVFDDPTIYVHISSKICSDDAPKGCENWFVMINVPNNEGQNWDEIIEKSRQNVLQKLTRNLNQNIENLILTDEYLDPRRIELNTSSAQGALYGNSSNNRYAAFLRHANFSKQLQNLYFCGGSVHPGGGIPLCLSSARITADLITKNNKFLV